MKLNVLFSFFMSTAPCFAFASKEFSEEVQFLLEKTKFLEANYRSLENEVRVLQTEVNVLRDENGKLHTQVDDQENTVKEIRAQLNNGLSEGQGIQSVENSSSGDQGIKHPQLLNHTVIEQQQRIRRASSNLGFSASINGNIGVVSNQVLVFGREVTNVDLRYSARSGHFTAPYEGLYFFTVTIVAMPNKYIEMEIVHNGNPLCYIYSGEGDSYYGPGTNSVVVHLATGDDVYIRVRGGQHGSGSVIDGAYSTFTGFILSPNV